MYQPDLMKVLNSKPLSGQQPVQTPVHKDTNGKHKEDKQNRMKGLNTYGR